MPIPERIHNWREEGMKFYAFNNRRIKVTQKRSLLPRKCFLSDKPLWFKKCEVVSTMLTGPGDPIFEDFWCDPKEFLLHELKR